MGYGIGIRITLSTVWMTLSGERIIHGLVGLAFWIGYLAYRRPARGAGATVGLLAAALVGTWVPDWDLMVGIEFHRSPLTHSALPAILFAWVTRPISRYSLPVGFALGLASHLFWDIIFFGDVRWIPGGAYDRLFLLLNSLGLVVWAIKKNGTAFRSARYSGDISNEQM